MANLPDRLRSHDGTRRFAVAALAGFFVFLFAVPISCCSFVLINQHRFGDVDRGGPVAILSALGVSAIIGGVVAGTIWLKTGRR